MDWTAIGVVFGYIVVALTVLVVVVGVTALFVLSVRSDYVESLQGPPRSPTDLERR